jgi:hypothetical protein
MAEAARPEALARLEVFSGRWALEASFPGDRPAAPDDPADSQARAGGDPAAAAQSVFEWALDGRYLMQRTEIQVPGAPDSLAIVSWDEAAGAYTQHYFDSRGVTRLYAMSFGDGRWELLRDSPDFSPLDFAQRFTGRFSADGSTIEGAWEKSFDGSTWEHDFQLTYRRLG